MAGSMTRALALAALGATWLAGCSTVPPPFEGPVSAQIQFTTPAAVSSICQEFASRTSPRPRGCAFSDRSVVMPHPKYLTPREFYDLMRHELAHARGWPGDHPTAWAPPTGPEQIIMGGVR